MKLDENKVIMGFSGGVDSAAAAILLKEQGFDVTALYFNITDSDAPCDVKENAEKLGLRLLAINPSKSFERSVIEPFCRLYAEGKTPNPCVMCNPEFKFRLLEEYADENGCMYVSTGHYAGIFNDGARSYICKAFNYDKDQSYMLARLPQRIIKRCIFPLSEFESKEEVRDIARKHGLLNADKKDSQDICFIPDGNYIGFLERRGYRRKPGNFIDLNGNVLGPHSGLPGYTVGQRKKLGIALGSPKFVCGINIDTGNVTLGGNEDLLHNTVMVNQLMFAGLSSEAAAERYEGAVLDVKLRYTRSESEAVLHFTGEDTLELSFFEAQRAPAPGQAAVFYNGDVLLGSGYIV